MSDIESKLLKPFKTAKLDLINLPTDVMLIEKLELPEPKSAGGLVMAKNVNQAQVTGYFADPPIFGMVLHTSKDKYIENTDEKEPMDLTPGCVIEISAGSIRYYNNLPILNYLPGLMGRILRGHVMLHWSSLENFHEFFNSIKL